MATRTCKAVVFCLLSIAVICSCIHRTVAAEALTPTAFLEQLACDSASDTAVTKCALTSDIELTSGKAVELPSEALRLSSAQVPPLGSDNGAGAPSNSSDGQQDTEGYTTLELAGQTNAFIVSAGGSVTLQRLRLTGAALPAAPYPLPPASFLALSAFQLPAAPQPAPPLTMVDVEVVTPSCVALSLHQDFACRAAPSPNFTVSPGSLTVHRLVTPSASLTNVRLSCSGAAPAPPPPCLAEVVSTGPGFLAALRVIQATVNATLAAATAAGTAVDPTLAHVYVSANVALAPPPPAAPPPPLALSNLKLRIYGAPGGATQVDLARTADLITLLPLTYVQVHNLTLRHPVTGPARLYPATLLRSAIWTFNFARSLFGARGDPALLLQNVTIADVPRDELATLVGDMTAAPPAALARLAGCHCMERNPLFSGYAGTVEIPDDPVAAPALVIERAASRGSREVLQGVRVQAAVAPAAAAPNASSSVAAVCSYPVPPAQSLCGLVIPVGVDSAPPLFQMSGVSPVTSPRATPNDFNTSFASKYASSLSARVSYFAPYRNATDVPETGEQPGTDYAVISYPLTVLGEVVEPTAAPTVLDLRRAKRVGSRPGNDTAMVVPSTRGLPLAQVQRGTNGSLTLRALALTGLTAAAVVEAAGADGALTRVVATQGLTTALANFTSCVWAVDFDRAAASAGASSTGSSGDGRPAGLPYVFLDGVTLVVPAPELQLLAWALTERPEALAAAVPDAGLAAQLAALAAGSAVPQQPAAGSHSLAFDTFSWCGLRGRRVTLTSQPVALGSTPSDASADLAAVYADVASPPVPLPLPYTPLGARSPAPSPARAALSPPPSGGVLRRSPPAATRRQPPPQRRSPSAFVKRGPKP